MIFDKSAKINRERTVVSKNGAGQTGYAYAKGLFSNTIYKNCQKVSKN